MKLGVFTVLFSQKSLDEALDYIVKSGLQAVELGTGNYPGNAHCNPEELLKDEKKIANLKKAVEKRGLVISALSCHGNPLHPQKAIADAHRKVQRDTILLAEKLGIDCVITFSGCPGDSPTAKYPNWVTCPWPDDFSEILNWQWEEVVIPYWKEEVAFAKVHGVTKIALEMHPGFVVYNTETLLKLRQAVGPEIGANFDPSHLFWQGMDPIASVRELGPAIFHVHAKDTRVDPINTAKNGVLDTKHYGDEIHRSWIFRTVGYGHDFAFWKDFVSTLRMVGYDYVLSIEHEDSLMSVNEGFQKAVSFLKEVLLFEETGQMWWA
ncbi:sugar phosphate isomerase/epimerase [candidate division KSB1 bacterium]|nr:MAG: sugar phosphate isomerase/epimerase [candidate division KSB1 bacterium]RKY79526.1 MAG: sugar phosphate isomerase/epimerase [candidate division KSB1 bacterium]RKY82307.1 MAG: sugar phosphate isomerase/epimerase [candidate division KSB1 bacterium]HDI51627.1 sugar phosphate isomerase/epimerase [Bacteroidota bacterium]